MVFAKRVEIYSDYTTHPSFICPNDAQRCELYLLVDSMNRNITPSKMIKQCGHGLCSYVNDVGNSFGFRLLPGDISFGAGLFKGYKIIEGEEAISTTTTTTVITATTTTLISCLNKPFLTCTSLPQCKWFGDLINGHCSDLTTTQLITSITTTTLPTTTMTIQSCLVKNSVCQNNNECCSGICERKCINPSLFGFCIFSNFVTRCQ